ncbi:tyrosine-type recombinase/integrase [Nostoc sp. KVJ3]|uniref:tyrosine-type recombinase/integrase n=1 Tax=Nostoc sp. KVJ3 TaxID=457945 RepID=UPI002236FB6C|nr:tyrosine-type recombinase/integrase [Nostoc sp. KVJ3]
MRLLWDNGLRRQEIVNLNVRDFNAKEKTLEILGKGKGSQKEVLDLSERTTDAISGWIKVSKKKRSNEALFTVLAYHKNGARLTGEAIRRLVMGYASKPELLRRCHRIVSATVRLLQYWI